MAGLTIVGVQQRWWVQRTTHKHTRLHLSLLYSSFSCSCRSYCSFSSWVLSHLFSCWQFRGNQTKFVLYETSFLFYWESFTSLFLILYVLPALTKFTEKIICTPPTSVVGMCAWDRLHSCSSTSFLCFETTIQQHSTTNFLLFLIFMSSWFLHFNETFHVLDCLRTTTLLP